MSFRTKFLLIALFGAVLPLGIVGLWLSRNAARAGEALLKAQLDSAVARIADDLRERWERRRSDLLLLAENRPVIRALRSQSPQDGPAGREAATFLATAYGEMSGDISRVVVRDSTGAARWVLRPGVGSEARRPEFGDPRVETSSAGIPALEFRYEVRDPRTRRRLGSLDARLPLRSLLPLESAVPGVQGAVLGVHDRESGELLAPAPVDGEDLLRGRFDHLGEQWRGARIEVERPPLILTLAAPAGPYVRPLQRSAQRGFLGLAAGALLAILGVGILTRRLTSSLEKLATAADAVARGEVDKQLRVDGDDEVARVARAFNTMTANLRRVIRRLSQREALASVGEVAGTLAHEVRNPLTSLRVDLQRLREQVEGREDLGGLVDRSLGEVDRLGEAVDGALRLVRSGQVRTDPVDLREPVERAAHAARPEFESRGGVLRVEELPDEPVRLFGDGGALEHVFLNLLLNAAQALNGEGRGTIRLEVAAESVRVHVEDTGPGIPPEELERVFEPFYTTRDEGTGFGLALSRRIVRAHGGDVHIRSRPGEGTTVTVELPRGEGWPERAEGWEPPADGTAAGSGKAPKV